MNELLIQVIQDCLKIIVLTCRVLQYRLFYFSVPRLKLYLEQFKISTCVLNSELPAKARCHAVYQFNQGLYDIIIASDEKALEAPQISSNNK